MHKRVQRYVCSRIQSRRRETAGRHTLPCSPYSTVEEIRASHGTVQVSTLFLRLADKFCDNFGVKTPLSCSVRGLSAPLPLLNMDNRLGGLFTRPSMTNQRTQVTLQMRHMRAEGHIEVTLSRQHAVVP